MPPPEPGTGDREPERPLWEQWEDQRAADAGHDGGQHEDEQLVAFRPVAEEAGAAFGVAHRDQHLAEF